MITRYKLYPNTKLTVNITQTGKHQKYLKPAKTINHIKEINSIATLPKKFPNDSNQHKYLLNNDKENAKIGIT